MYFLRKDIEVMVELHYKSAIGPVAIWLKVKEKAQNRFKSYFQKLLK